MHPINKVLSLFDIKISRVNNSVKQISSKEKEFLEKYEYYFKQVKSNKRGFNAVKEYIYAQAEHPSSHIDVICEFAAHHLCNAKPKNILDIGAWRQFIIGMLSHYDVTTIDVRSRKSRLSNETIITCDAKDLNIDSNSFDAVVNIGGFYTFGLGRYRDEFDLDTDVKAFNEMVRVLKSGGILIFLASITPGHPVIRFNRCRIYNYEMIKKFCDGLDCVEERYISRRLKNFCSIDEIVEPINSVYDFYVGCWKKR